MEGLREFDWVLKSDWVTTAMTEFTRPFVNILAGEKDVGTGTFLDRHGVRVMTCAHVARFDPSVYFLDGRGGETLRAFNWKVDSSQGKDLAVGSLDLAEWDSLSPRAQPLPMSKFAPQHSTETHELLFFRGIAGENVGYVGNLGVDAIITGYCSQEQPDAGDEDVFEMLWNPAGASLSTSTHPDVVQRFKYNHPGGFSGSLVWNTRFVECGCDLERWSPDQAVVTGLLRRFDPATSTLLVWRVEKLLQHL